MKLSDSGDIEVVRFLALPNKIIEIIGDDNVMHLNKVMSELQTYIDDNMMDEIYGSYLYRR